MKVEGQLDFNSPVSVRVRAHDKLRGSITSPPDDDEDCYKLRPRADEKKERVQLRY